MNTKPRYGYIAWIGGNYGIVIVHPTENDTGYAYVKGKGWNTKFGSVLDIFENRVDEFITEQEAYDMIKKYIENGNDPVDFYKEVKFIMH